MMQRHKFLPGPEGAIQHCNSFQQICYFQNKQRCFISYTGKKEQKQEKGLVTIPAICYMPPASEIGFLPRAVVAELVDAQR